jgi:hypothetical protein
MNHEVTVFERMEVEDDSIPLLKKIGVKQGMRSVLVDVPTEILEVLDSLDNKISDRFTGFFDYIHLFVENQEHLDAVFPKLKDHLNTGGMLWVS